MAVHAWLGLCLLVTLGLISAIALLSAMETAVLSARRSRLLLIQDRRTPVAVAVIESPLQFQTSAHLAKSLAESLVYAAAALVGMEGALLVQPDIMTASIGQILARTWPGIITGAITAYLAVTILAESLPKALACRNPERTLLRWIVLIRAFTLFFTPIFWFTSRLARILAFGSGLEPSLSNRAAHSEEEIKLLVEDSAEEGVLEEEEKEMIHSIFEFTDTIARQVMVPRIDVCGVDADTSLDEVVVQAMGSGHSRLPVYEGTVDKVVGVVHVKDMLPYLVKGRADVLVRELMRAPYFIPETKKIDELLQEFRRHKSQMAVVVDEFGGTSGLVTVEDVLEEIVGEIEDEYDVQERPGMEASDTGAGSLVDARMTIEDVNEQLCLELPAGDYETLGGFVFSMLGRPAMTGETIRHGSVELRVEDVDGVRLNKIRVMPVRDAEPASK
jgi:CBS domain containing-hemolysin-like protein